MGSTLVTTASKWIVRNLPAILTGTAVAGLGGTVYLAVKADREVQAIKRRQRTFSEKDWKTKYNVAYKLYVPAALAGAATAASIVGAFAIGNRRQAAAAAAYAFTKESYDRYRATARQEIGDDRERELATQAAERVKTPATTTVVGSGDVLFYDGHSGRYFHSTIETVRQIQNNLNYQLLKGDLVSLNDFYAAVGLEPTDLGQQLGWNEPNAIDIRFGSTITDDGKPCVVTDFLLEPTEAWFRFA